MFFVRPDTIEFSSYELCRFKDFFDPFTLYDFFFFALSFFAIDEPIWRLSLLEFFECDRLFEAIFCCDSNFLACLSEFFYNNARFDDVKWFVVRCYVLWILPLCKFLCIVICSFFFIFPLPFAIIINFFITLIQLNW
jgi:hypothetical protein